MSNSMPNYGRPPRGLSQANRSLQNAFNKSNCGDVQQSLQLFESILNDLINDVSQHCMNQNAPVSPSLQFNPAAYRQLENVNISPVGNAEPCMNQRGGRVFKSTPDPLSPDTRRIMEQHYARPDPSRSQPQNVTFDRTRNIQDITLRSECSDSLDNSRDRTLRPASQFSLQQYAPQRPAEQQFDPQQSAIQRPASFDECQCADQFQSDIIDVPNINAGVNITQGNRQAVQSTPYNQDLPLSPDTQGTLQRSYVRHRPLNINPCCYSAQSPNSSNSNRYRMQELYPNEAANDFQNYSSPPGSYQHNVSFGTTQNLYEDEAVYDFNNYSNPPGPYEEPYEEDQNQDDSNTDDCDCPPPMDAEPRNPNLYRQLDNLNISPINCRPNANPQMFVSSPIPGNVERSLSSNSQRQMQDYYGSPFRPPLSQFNLSEDSSVSSELYPPSPNLSGNNRCRTQDLYPDEAVHDYNDYSNPPGPNQRRLCFGVTQSLYEGEAVHDFENYSNPPGSDQRYPENNDFENHEPHSPGDFSEFNPIICSTSIVSIANMTYPPDQFPKRRNRKHDVGNLDDFGPCGHRSF